MYKEADFTAVSYYSESEYVNRPISQLYHTIVSVQHTGKFKIPSCNTLVCFVLLTMTSLDTRPNSRKSCCGEDKDEALGEE